MILLQNLLEFNFLALTTLLRMFEIVLHNFQSLIVTFCLTYKPTFIEQSSYKDAL